MWAIENPATGLLKTRPFGAPALGGRDLLQVRNSVQEADAAVDQHALEAEGRGLRGAWRTAGTSGPRSGGPDGEAVREGQPVTRAALQRSCCAVQGDCARGHGRLFWSNPRGLETSPFFGFAGQRTFFLVAQRRPCRRASPAGRPPGG